MTAPLHIFSGAPVAQNLCATAEIALKENLAAQKRATAPSAVEQQRSKLDFQTGQFHRNSAMPQCSTPWKD